MRKIVLGILVLGGSFAAALFVVNLIWPASGPDRRPALAAVPPLPESSRTSVVVAPVEIALDAIRTRIEAAAPRDLAGTNDDPVGKLLENAQLGWTIARGPLAVAGRPEGLAISAPLTGTLRLTGQLGTQAGSLGGALGNLLGADLGRQLGNLTGRVFDQRAEIRGGVQLTARPQLSPEWRLEPNLSGQVTIADAALSMAGIRVNVGNEVKPLLDRTLAEQIAVLQERLRTDRAIELAARREWEKMCRAVPLGAAAAGLPELWLEMRPTRALAAQPRVDAKSLVLVLGVQAETRIVPAATKPVCPFPGRLEMVPAMDQGRVSVAVPIDLPFSEVNRLLDAQLEGKTFPQDESGPVAVTVNDVSVTPSGDRLLVSLRVKARERKSFLGLGGEADVYVWGRPVLDAEAQLLKLADIALDVESEAAFGLLGTAARAAIPYLRSAVADNAVIDLKPFAANARQRLTDAIADFRKRDENLRVDAAITDVRLTGIAFDAKTLRVIAEAQGSARVSVTALPGP